MTTREFNYKTNNYKTTKQNYKTIAKNVIFIYTYDTFKINRRILGIG
jgi:hypothetical protein